MPWVRPDSVPVGQVWLRFQGKERNGGPAQMYQIRDMEEDRRKECLDFMVEQFRDEPLSRVFGLHSDPESIDTIYEYWGSYIDRRVCLACYTEVDGQPDELVGFNIQCVMTRDYPDEDLSQVKGEPWRKLLAAATAVEELVNIFDHYSVDRYLCDAGLAVSAAHRGQGIGQKLLEARKPLVQALGLEAISTVFTGKISQILAQRCGYELLASLPYEELLVGEDKTPIDTECIELRGVKYSF